MLCFVCTNTSLFVYNVTCNSQDIVRAIDNYGGRDFWYKVSNRPRKADNESEERRERIVAAKHRGGRTRSKISHTHRLPKLTVLLHKYLEDLCSRTWEVWKGQSVWWWDGCVGCPWKTESTVRIYATFLVLIVLLMWWGVEDWDGLDIWSVRVWMIGCLLAEGWWWRWREVGDGVGRHGNSVLGMTWNCLVCILSGLFLGICGGTWFGANV